MSQTKQKEGIISDERIEDIINTLHSFNYSSEELTDNVVLPLAQWLQQEGFSIENTGYILSSVININNLQDKLDEIYDPNFPPLYSKTSLVNFLDKVEFERLDKVVCPPKIARGITTYMDTDTKLKIDFINCNVSIYREYTNRQGEEIVKVTPVIDAVPKKLIVYDSEFVKELPRSFRITWQSKFSNRLFTSNGDGTGATIQDIEKSIVSAGYSRNKRLLGDTITAMINSMISEGLAEMKDTIDNKGIYYNIKSDNLLVVKLNTSKPSNDEILKGISTLDELHSAYSKESVTFATVMKWSLVSIFAYSIKQTGNWLPWLYLVGAGQSGKTTLANIGTYFYGEPNQKTNIGGGSFNSEYRIGNVISQDCTMRVVNEPASTFRNESTTEIVKNSVELEICREIQGKIYPAFSPVIFTANNFIPEMDSLYRRLFIIDFEYNQRKSNASKKAFENKFNVQSPAISCLKALQVFGRIAIRAVMSDTSLLFEDWQVLADKLFKKAYESVDMTVPDWLLEWSKDKDLDDLDNTQIENIRGILVEELYHARKRVTLRGDYGQVEEFTLDGDEVSSNSKEFESLYWDLINERVFNWCLPHKPRGKPKSVFLNQGFKKLLNSHLEEVGTLKSIGQLLHWEYKKVNFKNTQSRGLLVPFDKFMSFVYPSVDNDELE
jgi:hypothetical protein